MNSIYPQSSSFQVDNTHPMSPQQEFSITDENDNKILTIIGQGSSNLSLSVLKNISPSCPSQNYLNSIKKCEEDLNSPISTSFSVQILNQDGLEQEKFQFKYDEKRQSTERLQTPERDNKYQKIKDCMESTTKFIDIRINKEIKLKNDHQQAFTDPSLAQPKIILESFNQISYFPPLKSSVPLLKDNSYQSQQSPHFYQSFPLLNQANQNPSSTQTNFQFVPQLENLVSFQNKNEGDAMNEDTTNQFIKYYYPLPVIINHDCDENDDSKLISNRKNSNMKGSEDNQSNPLKGYIPSPEEQIQNSIIDQIKLNHQHLQLNPLLNPSIQYLLQIGDIKKKNQLLEAVSEIKKQNNDLNEEDFLEFSKLNISNSESYFNQIVKLNKDANTKESKGQPQPSLNKNEIEIEEVKSIDLIPSSNNQKKSSHNQPKKQSASAPCSKIIDEFSIEDSQLEQGNHHINQNEEPFNIQTSRIMDHDSSIKEEDACSDQEVSEIQLRTAIYSTYSLKINDDSSIHENYRYSEIKLVPTSDYTSPINKNETSNKDIDLEQKEASDNSPSSLNSKEKDVNKDPNLYSQLNKQILNEAFPIKEIENDCEQKENSTDNVFKTINKNDQDNEEDDQQNLDPEQNELTRKISNTLIEKEEEEEEQNDTSRNQKTFVSQEINDLNKKDVVTEEINTKLKRQVALLRNAIIGLLAIIIMLIIDKFYKS